MPDRRRPLCGPHQGRGGVRRLTPRECEWLQSFPDDYTLIPGYGGMVFRDDADRAAMAAYLGFGICDGLDGVGTKRAVAAMERFDPPADGPRYKALGNSMNVTVMRWILSRIVAAERERGRA